MAGVKTMAIVRGIPDSFDQAITMESKSVPINVERAREQHHIYCEVLSSLGLEIIRIPTDHSLPDCCFTEDPATVIGDVAIIMNMAAGTRVAETVAVEKELQKHKRIARITEPATMDGGDVLPIGNKIFIGLSGRTNAAAIEQVRTIAGPMGYEVIPVKIWNTLHLKSVATYLGEDTIIYAPDHFDPAPFAGFNLLATLNDEEYCADTLHVNGKVLIPAGYPKTKSMLEREGFSTIELDMSEIQKADAALTCLSIVL